jgi:MFS family permease
VQPWHILILAFCLGTANAFDAPARQSFILEMVDREDLTNAIALNSTLFNLSAAVGPAVAGVIYMMMGPAWCFTLNAVSFIAVIIALYMMKVKPQPAVVQSVSALSSLREGLRYVFLNTHILALIIIVAITTLFGFSFNTLIPAWAFTILGGNAATNGLLQSARGFGALLSALFLASLGRFQYKGKLLTGGTFAFPIILLFFAIVRWLPLSLLMLFCLGIAFLLVMNLSNALLQIVVPDHLRGRVMSIYSLTLFGLMPVGGLLAGIIAEWAGEPETVILSAILCFICSVMVRIFAPKVYRLN